MDPSSPNPKIHILGLPGPLSDSRQDLSDEQFSQILASKISELHPRIDWKATSLVTCLDLTSDKMLFLLLFGRKQTNGSLLFLFKTFWVTLHIRPEHLAKTFQLKPKEARLLSSFLQQKDTYQITQDYGARKSTISGQLGKLKKKFGVANSVQLAWKVLLHPEILQGPKISYTTKKEDRITSLPVNFRQRQNSSQYLSKVRFPVKQSHRALSQNTVAQNTFSYDPLQLSQLISLLQSMPIALYLFHEESHFLTSLYTPSAFPLPPNLTSIVQRMSESSVDLSFSDLNWHGNNLQGKVFHTLKIDGNLTLLFLFPFHYSLDLDKNRLLKLKPYLSLRHAHLPQYQGLTLREFQVAKAFFFSGFSNEELAKKLGRSTHTVRSHLREVFKKMGVKSRLELFWKLLRYLELREVESQNI